MFSKKKVSTEIKYSKPIFVFFTIALKLIHSGWQVKFASIKIRFTLVYNIFYFYCRRRPIDSEHIDFSSVISYPVTFIPSEVQIIKKYFLLKMCASLDSFDTNRENFSCFKRIFCSLAPKIIHAYNFKEKIKNFW